MLLEEVTREYLYHCEAKGFTPKTMANKRLELKQFLKFLTNKRGITKLENVTTFDLKAYIRYKQSEGLKPQSVLTLYKMVSAFFNWCYRGIYLRGVN